ncbi:uncharacterized protein LOC130624150 [Hydractinia symbiolongicarpus]|uniref:uncharacterized protein LOC130624150 n=1 Tax=Hydractinia symbiolongicarpus TaxID=13093 RepID=UPI00254E91DB|nr:uncharacterized protein LOC130624150 [Hydractinia symbiolongicarpus]XP_057295700.1 uncharacterized protein LOC130624150 [Hydractinia symbiolongicarpus]
MVKAHFILNIVHLMLCVGTLGGGIAFIYAPEYGRNNVILLKRVYVPIWAPILLAVNPILGLIGECTGFRPFFHVKLGFDIWYTFWWMIGAIFYAHLGLSYPKCFGNTQGRQNYGFSCSLIPCCYKWNADIYSSIREDSFRLEYKIVVYLIVLYFTQTVCLIASIISYYKEIGCCQCRREVTQREIIVMRIP